MTSRSAFAREVGEGVTGPGVAAEHDRGVGHFDPIGKAGEVGLCVLDFGRGDLPVGSRRDRAGFDVMGVNRGRLALAAAAAIAVGVQAHRVIGPRDDIGPERADVFSDQPVGHLPRGRGSVDVQRRLASGHHVESSQQEARVVGTHGRSAGG